MAWASLGQARAWWADAQHLPDDTLTALLEDATHACQEYAPSLMAGAERPAGWARACVLQARELWAAAQRDGDLIGTDELLVRARPLTGAVRQLLRPRRGKPVIR